MKTLVYQLLEVYEAHVEDIVERYLEHAADDEGEDA